MTSVSMLHTNVKVQCVINKVIKVQSLAATHRDLQCTKAAMEFSHILTQGWTKSYNFNYQDLTYLDSHIQWAKRVNTNINTKDTTNIKCQKLDWPPPVKHRSGQIGWPAASGPLHIFTSSQKHANQICLTLSGCFFNLALKIFLNNSLLHSSCFCRSNPVQIGSLHDFWRCFCKSLALAFWPDTLPGTPAICSPSLHPAALCWRFLEQNLWRNSSLACLLLDFFHDFRISKPFQSIFLVPTSWNP